LKEILIFLTVFMVMPTEGAFPTDALPVEIEMPSTNGSLELSPKVQSETSLRIAARSGRLKEVIRSLNEGVDVNGSGSFGETALMYAARYDFPQVVEALLDHGAETNARDSADNTALHLAAKNCSVNSAQMILSKGADANWINSQGKTALIEASEDGCFPIVKVLVQARGVDLAQEDNQMKTALDYALEESFSEVGGPYSMIRDVLRNAGGPTNRWVIPTPRPQHIDLKLAQSYGPLP
jgi:ankyrin repeat protein